MSSASSETAESVYSQPKIACVFLAKFDTREGYKMIWSKSINDISTEGLEYKALPSGIHDHEAATLYITHEVQGKRHYGLARFRQLNLNEGTDNDRDLVRMYSIGVLLEPIRRKHWKPNEFSNVGWEHLDTVDDTLLAFLKDENMDRITNLYDRLTGSLLAVKKPSMANHPLNKLPAVLSVVGPLIFPIYKAGLLRKRILIFNHSSQGGELVQESSSRDHAICGALAYLISVISVVPKDVQVEPSDGLLYSQPLYTVGLHDMDSDFASNGSYIANTSDEVMKYQKNLFDVAVMMPSTEAEYSSLADSSLKPMKATFNDYTKFLKLFRKIPGSSASSDDSSSIRTYSSLFSAFKNEESDTSREPLWWLQDATSPMSWREYVWLAFAWFASAGTTQRNATENCTDTEPRDDWNSLRQQFIQLTMIVGHFHKLTKKWFYLIDEIVAEALEDRGCTKSSGSKVKVDITHQDIVDMELDPYSAQDQEFVREFVILYWGSVVEEVEIGLGIHGICC